MKKCYLLGMRIRYPRTKASVMLSRLDNFQDKCKQITGKTRTGDKKISH